MKRKIKLVKGNEDERFETEPTNKKKMVSLNIGLTQKELTQMKALSGLRGNVVNDQIVKEYIKSKLRYGWKKQTICSNAHII